MANETQAIQLKLEKDKSFKDTFQSTGRDLINMLYGSEIIKDPNADQVTLMQNADHTKITGAEGITANPSYNGAHASVTPDGKQY